MGVIDGNNQDNNIKGTRKADKIDAKGGDDKVNGLGGNDKIDGKGGDDDLRGGSGDDEVRGSPGNDRVRGDAGDDFLFGGRGNDTLSGGGGVDEFHFIVDTGSAAGKDKIVDFDERTEFINLGSFGSFNQLDTNRDGELTNADDFVSVRGQTTRIDVGAAFGFGPGSEVLTVTNAINSPLDANDFRFTDPF